ncbi:MAG: hypothetical protein QME59_07365, partial [Candidatus Hydrothermarchaeota archaeon]|nr:hypothetical protein [Candidatus Hydrothermarchaeota archaeon]
MYLITIALLLSFNVPPAFADNASSDLKVKLKFEPPHDIDDDDDDDNDDAIDCYDNVTLEMEIKNKNKDYPAINVYPSITISGDPDMTYSLISGPNPAPPINISARGTGNYSWTYQVWYYGDKGTGKFEASGYAYDEINGTPQTSETEKAVLRIKQCKDLLRVKLKFSERLIDCSDDVTLTMEIKNIDKD